MTLTDKTEALLPCPFCGGAPSTLRQNGAVQATCDNFDCPAFDVFAPIAAWNRRALPARGVGVQERVQHKKRGSTYRVVGRGKVQTDTPLTDYAEVVVYQCEADGTVWVRPVSEFEDGRFAALAPMDAAQAREAALPDFVTLLTDAAAVAMKAREAALREAADLCDKSTFEGGLAKSMALFLRAEDHAVYRRACEDYRDAILRAMEGRDG